MLRASIVESGSSGGSGGGCGAVAMTRERRGGAGGGGEGRVPGEPARGHSHTARVLLLLNISFWGESKSLLQSRIVRRRCQGSREVRSLKARSLTSAS